MISFILIWLFFGYSTFPILLFRDYPNKSKLEIFLSPLFVFELIVRDIKDEEDHKIIAIFIAIFTILGGFITFNISLVFYIKELKYLPIKKFSDLKYRKMRHGNTVIFNINNKTLTYTILFNTRGNYIARSSDNYFVLNELEILNKNIFYEKYYKDLYIGYSTDCPYFVNKKYLKIYIKQLFIMCEEVGKR